MAQGPNDCYRRSQIPNKGYDTNARRYRRLRSHDGRILKKVGVARLSIPDGNEVRAVESQSRRKEIGLETPYNHEKASPDIDTIKPHSI